MQELPAILVYFSQGCLLYTGFDMFMSISTNETTKALSLKIVKDMKKIKIYSNGIWKFAISFIIRLYLVKLDILKEYELSFELENIDSKHL